MSPSRRSITVIILLLTVSLAGAAADYTIAVLPDPPDGGSVEGGGTYPAGETVTLTALPNIGYAFVGWFEEGETVSVERSFELTVDRDRELSAKFEPIPLKTALSGRFDLNLQILPDFAFERTRIETGFSNSSGDLSSLITLIATLTDSGLTGLDLRLTGRFAGLGFGGGASFDPATSGYKSSYIDASFSLYEALLSLRANHYATGGGAPTPYLLLTASVRFDPFFITAHADGNGCLASFSDILIRFSGIPLCCGISLQGCASFTCADGFSYLRLLGKDVYELPSGITLDAEVKFTTTGKEISITPHFSGFGKTIFKIYGDIVWDPSTFSLGGYEIYGMKLRCCFDCGSCPGADVSAPYIELLGGFDPSHVPGGFTGDEFEYVKGGFCGPVCCGGYYSLETTAYFSHSSTSLFGISRLILSWSFPFSDDLKFTGEAELDTVTNVMTVDIGWSWRF